MGITDPKADSPERDTMDRYKRTVAEADRRQAASDAERLAHTRTRDELYDEAARLKIDGRSEMSKEELAEAIRRDR